MIHQYCLTINPAESPAPGPLPLFVPGWPVRVMLGMEESPSLSASSGYLAFSSFSSFHSTSHCWQETARDQLAHTLTHTCTQLQTGSCTDLHTVRFSILSTIRRREDTQIKWIQKLQGCLLSTRCQEIPSDLPERPAVTSMENIRQTQA